MSERYVRDASSKGCASMRPEFLLTFQVFRVLKPNGVFIYVTYRQPHFIKPLLNCKGVQWDTSLDVLGGSESSFDYSGFALKKVTPLVVESVNAEENITDHKNSSQI